MRILLANPRGFCAGVNMAVECLSLVLERLGPPVYVYHEIVHNKYIVASFRKRGAVFVDRVEDVPRGSTLLFSAHGVAPEVREAARALELQTIDATCPLVTKVHLEAIRFAREGYTILLVGHAGHDEVIGTIGEAPDAIRLVESEDDVDRLDLAPDAKVAYLTQTTLSIDEAEGIIGKLRGRFPHIVGPPKEDICYATQNRQEAVRMLAQDADIVLVLGSQNSSNSQRLRELAAQEGVPAYLIDGAGELEPDWFSADQTVVITAGASAPESLVEGCVDWLCRRYNAKVEEVSVRDENVQFALPREIRSWAAPESAHEGGV